MLADSRLLNDLQTFANSPLGNPYCIYGDPAYPLRAHLIAPFRNGVLTSPMMEFNQSMSTVRESVEWLFNDITNYFKFLDLKKKLKNWPQQCRQNVCCRCPPSKCPYMPLWQSDILLLSVRPSITTGILCLIRAISPIILLYGNQISLNTCFVRNNGKPYTLFKDSKFCTC